ncbi:lipid A-modifier LpxR family protein [Flammeovirga yaeyamensis]
MRIILNYFINLVNNKKSILFTLIYSLLNSKFIYFKCLILITFFSLQVKNTHAQEKKKDKEKSPFYFNLTVDEDLFLLKSTDQFYSFGTAITAGWKGLDNKFTRALTLKAKDSHDLYTVSFAHRMYTPKNVEQTEVDSTDIPFCGQTFLRLGRESFSPSHGYILETYLDIGVVGEIAGADFFQNKFHSAIGNGAINGWKNQIGNGLLLNYTVIYKQDFVSVLPFVENFLILRATVGTMDISAEGSIQLRIGLFNNHFVNGERPWSKKENTSSFYKLKETKYAKMKYNSGMWSQDETLREQSAESWLSRNFKITQAYIKFVSGGMLNVYSGEMQGSLIPFEESPYVIEYHQIPKLIHTLSVGVVLTHRIGAFEYHWDRHNYQPENTFPPLYPKWGRFNMKFNF